MSGFITIVHRDQQLVDPSVLQRMVSAIHHRGPDRQSAWHNHHVGMGHLLLATTRHATGEVMPAERDSGRLLITGDLRLDDREELWRDLSHTECFDPDTPDSCLILESYERWGADCPSHLLGDFAFVIWDSRAQQIFAARDPFGIKPFYYHYSEKLFAAASEIKALLAIETIGQNLDETWLADYLAVLDLDGETTIYKDIKCLLPATRMIVNRHGMTQSRYWDLDSERELHFKSDREYLDAFRELFFKAVDRRLRSNYPVGAYLSGGLDSSSIVCVARNLMRRRGEDHLQTIIRMATGALASG
jgi:asparagine synthase (glutamine-hydrolysing)